MHLPFKLEKCYYKGAKDVVVYEQMLKAGLRFPLSALHHRLLQYLGLAVTKISPNAWRVFLGAEVLYGVMSNGARRMTVEEFFHYYRPSKITQSKSMHSFVPRSLLLRLVCNTSDSNRNWKSCYWLISLSKGTTGCVTLVTKSTCQWTKPGVLCPHSVCIRLY